MHFVVILNMRERLGNQLFQYSFARNIMNLCSDSVLVINDDVIKKKIILNKDGLIHLTIFRLSRI